jgi:hypothetical protein
MHSSWYNWWYKAGIWWEVETKNNDKVLGENRKIIQITAIVGIGWEIRIDAEIRISNGISLNSKG